MPKTSIYFPRELADQLTESGLNVSAICQEALRKALEELPRKCSKCGQELPRGLNRTVPEGSSDDLPDPRAASV